MYKLDSEGEPEKFSHMKKTTTSDSTTGVWEEQESLVAGATASNQRVLN